MEKSLILYYGEGERFVLFDEGSKKCILIAAGEIPDFLKRYKEYATNAEYADRWQELPSDVTLETMKLVAIYATGANIDTPALTILDPLVFDHGFASDRDAMEGMVTAKEYAAIHGKSVDSVKKHCQQGHIEGARKLGQHSWLIPSNAPYPKKSRAKAE